MPDARSELSSISASLDELTRRIAAIAEANNANGEDDLAGELFEVERALVAGHRRLARLIK